MCAFTLTRRLILFSILTQPKMHFEKKKIIELAGGKSRVKFIQLNNSDLIFFQILYEDTGLKELFLILL